VGVSWSGTGNVVAATEGTQPFQYAVTSGALPAGLTLDASSGAISGTPAAAAKGYYPITVTATDSAAIPLTGAVTFTLAVDGGL
jgi:hypothetical protein